MTLGSQQEEKHISTFVGFDLCSCSLSSQSHLHPPAPLDQPAVQCRVSEVARPVPVAIAPPRVVIQTQSPTLTERTGLSPSISCLPLELTGLEGPISTRTAMCCPRSNSPTLEDLNSIPLVVRLNGHFFSVPVQPSLTSDLSDLPSSILASLQPSREPLTGGAPWLRFHGCPVSHCSSAQPIRPLRPSEAPKTWAELRTLNLVSGFVEVRMPCRGGADQPSAPSPP